jgi:S-DNA-T family DNA segregation ATPase FtsK/SpoIIIE
MTCARRIVDKCAEFGMGGQILHVHPGPVVTTYELKPDAGIKLSRIVNLEDDLAMALRAETIRIDRIPGKSTIGIEVPNSRREVITFRELAESDVFEESRSRLTMILGKTIDGAPYVADLARMPHLLIAGSTGSGKSVCLNAMITSVLYKARPEEVKLIMVDPKMLELGMYADIPHLLTPVVTNPKLAANALKWAVREMEERYACLAQCGVRNIEQYNAWVEKNTRDGERPKTREGEDHSPLPFVMIVIDELADLMMIAAGDVEDSICRLAQMARAVGIHLILATQRPSVDVITGVIKANLPARIAMRVASKVDSRTILDSNGAEQLLGKGDMLFLPAGSSRLLRLHGPYLSETETEAICDYLRNQRTPTYDESVCEDPSSEKGERGGSEKDDDLFEAAARLVVERGEASVSYLQRRLKVGYSRAARLVDMLEDDGIVGPSEGSKVRQVLVRADYFAELDRQRDLAGSP